MSYLVHCPTCNGKMSVNARVCPHCGETEFFEYIPHREEVKCYYESPEYALGCKGKGFLCKTEVPCHLYEGDGWGSGVRVGAYHVAATRGTPLWKILEDTVPYGDFHIETYGPGNNHTHKLYVHKVRCPQCNGTGWRIIDSGWSERTIDLRKPVE